MNGEMKLTWSKPDEDGITRCNELPVSIVASVKLDHGEPESWHILIGAFAPIDYLDAGSYGGAMRAVGRLVRYGRDPRDNG